MSIVFKKILTWIFILLPIFLLGMVFDKYAINIPHWDDHALKGFVLNFEKSDSFIDKLKLIFSQHNEHRIALTRIFTLIILKIKGTIDYKWLMILGGMALIGVLFIFKEILKKYNYSSLFLIPISFILFGLHLNENLFWGMASVQNFWVILLAIWIFYLVSISNHKYSLLFAIFLTFWAINTSGNGFLIPLICYMILLFQKRKRAFFIYFSFTLLFIFFYFFFYQKPPITSVTARVTDPQLLIQGVLAMVGSAVDFKLINPSRQIDVSMVVGIVLMIVFGFLIQKVLLKKYNVEFKNIDLFLIAIVLFCLATIGAVVLNRLNLGLPALLTSKYKIYSIILLIVALIVLLNSIPIQRQKNFIGLNILASILFWIYGYILDYQAVVNMRMERICNLFNSESIGIYPYKPEKTILDEFKFAITDTTKKSDLRKYEIDMKPNFLTIKEPLGTFDYDFKSADNGLYLVLKSDKKTYILPTNLNIIGKKNQFKMAFNLSFQVMGHGFESPNFGVVDGKYQLGVIKVENQKKSMMYATQIVDIKGVTKENESKNW
jgi:hypothetical protein